MSDVIGIGVDGWDETRLGEKLLWLDHNYGPSTNKTWYIDYQPLCTDLVMNREIYFFFKANNWEYDY